MESPKTLCLTFDMSILSKASAMVHRHVELNNATCASAYPMLYSLYAQPQLFEVGSSRAGNR